MLLTCLAHQLSRFFRLIFRVRKGTEGLSNWTRPGGLKALFAAEEGPRRDTGHLTQEVGEPSLPLSTWWLTLFVFRNMTTICRNLRTA